MLGFDVKRENVTRLVTKPLGKVEMGIVARIARSEE